MTFLESEGLSDAVGNPTLSEGDDGAYDAMVLWMLENEELNLPCRVSGENARHLQAVKELYKSRCTDNESFEHAGLEAINAACSILIDAGDPDGHCPGNRAEHFALFAIGSAAMVKAGLNLSFQPFVYAAGIYPQFYDKVMHSTARQLLLLLSN